MLPAFLQVGTSRDDWKEMPRTTYFGPPNHNNNTIDGFIFIQPRENEIEGETEVLEGMCERRNDSHFPS